MTSWQYLAKVDDVPEGTGTELVVEGTLIALFHADGQFYALDGVCPHAGGPLGKGSLAGHVVTCPWHGWQFDVSTGQHCLNPNLHHRTFPLKMKNDEIHIDIS